MSKNFSLGKGLSSLIPIKSARKIEPEADKTDSVFYIEVNKIKPNPNQPRKEFDEAGIKELSQSIKKYGILQPLLVNKIEKETTRGLEVYYQLIAGERRLKAAKIANLPHVPVIVRDTLSESESGTNNGESLEIALIENIQRKNLNVIEEAKAYKRLNQEFKMSYSEIAAQVAKDYRTINNIARLLNLPSEIQQAVSDEKISYGHARALLGIHNPEKQRNAFERILAGGFTVRDTESLAVQLGNNAVKKVKTEKFNQLELNLTEKLDTPVAIAQSERGEQGKISIKFANLEHLNTIVKKILD